jgi:hypothetical protein
VLAGEAAPVRPRFAPLIIGLQIDGLACLTALKVLVLAFNELSRMDTIQDLPALERLDLFRHANAPNFGRQ